MNSADECAALVGDVVPLVQRTIRAEMRRHRSADLSLPQFRSLGYLRRNPGASLSDLAEHIGLTLPSISKMIDRLVTNGLVTRGSATGDRRRISLKLTTLGESTLRSADGATRNRLAEILAALSPDEQAIVVQAMQNLRKVFGETPKEDSKG